jgi:hypothetical protein
MVADQTEHFDRAANDTPRHTMSRVLAILSMILGGLSVFALIEDGLRNGFAAPVKLVIDYYHLFLEVTLGWAQPYLHWFIEMLRSLSGWDLHLQPWWKINVAASVIVAGALASSIAAYEGVRWWVRIPILAVGALAGVLTATKPMVMDDWLSQQLGENIILFIVFASAAGLSVLWFLDLVLGRFRFLPAFLQFLLRPLLLPAAGVFGETAVRVVSIFAGAMVWVVANAGLKLLGL